VLPLLGIAFAVYLMTDLPGTTWIRFVVWLVIGLLIYAVYGYRHSRLRAEPTSPTNPTRGGTPTRPIDE